MWTFFGLVAFAVLGVFVYRLSKLVEESTDATVECMRKINEQHESPKTDKRGINDE